jgi:hypothetical protein
MCICVFYHLLYPRRSLPVGFFKVSAKGTNNIYWGRSVKLVSVSDEHWSTPAATAA